MKAADRNNRLKQLVELSRRIGNAVEGFAILGEGNTSQEKLKGYSNYYPYNQVTG